MRGWTGWMLPALGAVAVLALGRRRAPDGGEPAGPGALPVRDAGPEGMRDPPPDWDLQDQRVDESFPASDPPGTY